MAMKLLIPEEKELEVRCEPLEVTSCLPERDPKWSFIDKHGHKHRWHIPAGAKEWMKQGCWKLPTLRAVNYIICYEEGEPVYGTHHYCKRCGELIQPGYRSGPYRRYIAGPAQYYLDGETIDKARAEAILAKSKEERC